MELKPIFSEDNGEYLEHYGVPGMKWGVRHDRERTGRKRRQVGEFKNGKYSVGTALRANYHMNSNDMRKAQIKGALRKETSKRVYNKAYRDAAAAKGKTKAVERYNKQIAKSDAKIKALKSERTSLSRDTAAIKKRIEKSGLATVKTSTCPRTTLSNGEQYVKQALYGNFAYASIYSYRNTTPGTNYQVRKKK